MVQQTASSSAALTSAAPWAAVPLPQVVQVLHRGFEQARHAGQLPMEAHRGRTAGQRMGQANGGVGDALVRLQGPFADIVRQLA